MQHTSHKDLWNLAQLVDEYDIEKPLLTWPEVYLIEKAKTHFKHDVQNILCVGCGGGREVLPIHNEFQHAVIYANDIATNMIETAKKNFEHWGIANVTKTLNCPVDEINMLPSAFEFITCFNNVISFILPYKNRQLAFNKMYELNSSNGVVVGMVHHIYSTPMKTLYFMLQRLTSLLSKFEFGDKSSGRKNQKYYAHYFERSELEALLSIAGYTNIWIVSLEEYYTLTNRKYPRRTGWNNLIFFAVKP